MKKSTFPVTFVSFIAISGCAGLNGPSQPLVERTACIEPRPPALSADIETVANVETVAFIDEKVTAQTEVNSAGSSDNNANDDQTNAQSPVEPCVITPISLVESTVSYGTLDTFIEAEVYPSDVTTYTLADIEALALGNNPALQSAQATTTKASGFRVQVGKHPNPTLGYFGQQIADRNTDQHGIFVEQEFVRGDKLALNREVLRHTQRAQVAETETQRYRVLTDVRVRFFEAIAAEQQVDATRDFAEVARRGVQVAKDRQEAEEGTLIETLQSQTLLSEVTLAAEQAEVAYLGAWKELAAIAGLQASTPARLVADLATPIRSPDWETAYAEIVSESPELTAAQAIVCEKQTLLRRQQAQMIPNVNAQVGAGYDNSTDHGMINVQLSAPIPVWNQNKGNISAAYSSYVRATQEVQRIEQSIRARLARAAQDFESAMRSVRKYEDEIIPQAEESLELSEEAYRAGELDFLQVLIVRRSFYESTIRLIQARGNLAQASARVDGLLLTGGLQSPTDYTDGVGIRDASFNGQ